MIDADTKRLSRLIALLALLQTKRLFKATELAARFGVSVRTIYRDIRSLEAAGIPLMTEEGKGYRLLDSYRLPPVMLSEQEANAIITAQHLISVNKDSSFLDAYGLAVQKIKAVFGRTTRDRANVLDDRLKVYPKAKPVTTSNHLPILQRALTNYQLIDNRYRSAQNEATSRQVEPFALLLSTEADWLLVGWCRLRQGFRIFRLDRISSLHVLNLYFEPHSITLKQYFDTLGE
ncbi:helix-turn-helix transcriptional regulator [Persicitalea jodogahamensis]|uniref:DNA-binding transcriptional regulator n=1 Tax=Persicitalea jodogahamensis TaxID=402147 RepID=A0A8J3GCR4_9BACT|nr:YafY family protein [Persicitalea jodogahamensis]GHB86412.1 DNA-binding transcriptional regulator [Persicitalea jodogahamensis]